LTPTADVQAAAHPVIAKMKEQLRPTYQIRNEVAVLPVSGVLMQNPDPWEMAFGGAEDLNALTELVGRATADPEAQAIVLNLDTPGGMMTGGVELADAVAAADKVKPVIAWTGSLAASLGYLIGSQASQFVATRSAQVGSIGTILSVTDFSALYEKFGVKVHTFTNKEATLKTVLPMNEERAAYLQGRADKAFAMFKGMVTAKRPDVNTDAMKGQVFTAAEGKRLGLVDRVGDLNFAVGLARSEARRRQRGA
jgi:signal peptide peptidase SppA